MRGARKLINRRPALVAFIASAALIMTFFRVGESEQATVKPPAESYTQLETRIEEGKVESLTYNPASYTVTVHEKNRPDYTIGVFGRSGEERLLRLAAANDVELSSKALELQPSALDRFFALLPTLLIIALVVFLLRNMMPLKRGKLEPVTSTVSFTDIAGVDEAVEELAEVRDFLADPKKFERLGARVPKGVLLYGPPGTGKTLLARAVANEAGVPFFSMSGSDFVEMFAGLGAARVRALFKKAKEASPSIVFIDELDAVGRARNSGGSGAEREADQTLNQLLTEMDGFQVNEHPIIVMAASNRLDVLDKALLRPGRFDRHVSVDAPDRQGRREILELHGRGKSFAADVDLETLAIQTSGMTGAELAHLLNEAAIFAARRGASEISQVDVEDALMRVVAGVKKHRRQFSDHERRVVAYHEAGHAVVSERAGTQNKVHKISILPRGQSGGQTVYVSDEDVFMTAQPELERRLSALLGGRAAEQMVFGQVTTGAADDLKRASEIARAMVMRLGMGTSFGLLSIESRDEASPGQLQEADTEVRKLLELRYAEAQRILEEEAAALTRVAEALLTEETIDRGRFLELLEQPVESPAVAAAAAVEALPHGESAVA